MDGHYSNAFVRKCTQAHAYAHARARAHTHAHAREDAHTRTRRHAQTMYEDKCHLAAISVAFFNNDMTHFLLILIIFFHSGKNIHRDNGMTVLRDAIKNAQRISPTFQKADKA